MFLDHDKAELAAILDEMGFSRFRLSQIRRWVFARKASSFDDMTDLSKADRALLAERFKTVFQGRELTRHHSDDSTEKLLIEWPDGQRIECVLLRDDRDHRTACISTQVGCAMGCVFCASGMDGFVRNLSRGEILEQLLRLNALLPNTERLTHVVVMGIGEPLLNLDALLPALDDATASDGLDLSARRVTISTVGIPKGIRALAATLQATASALRAKPLTVGKPYKLAVSLHAPNDDIRSKIIPQNRFTGIADILRATDEYFQRTGRRVTFEYTLIDHVNDRPEHAAELVRLLKDRTAIVNVIPLNPIPELDFRTPSSQAVRRFVERLESGGLQVKVRFRKGDKISAACGQLRRVHRKKD